MKKIFISYKRTNKNQVFQLVKRIENQLGIKCWVDLDGIESSTQFASKICSAIDNAEVVIFMHSSAHLNIDYDNDWTIKELNYAHQTNKKVVLVRLDNAPLLNIFLMEYGTKNNIDSNEPDQVDKLINDLGKWINSKNNTNSKAADFHGKEWQVGDYYDLDGKEGVVFWVDESKKHGKILSIDQTQKSWCIYREFNKQLLTGCNSKVDGLLNLQAIEKIPNWKDKYPAFAWCANHGQGWYLPAIEELETFLSNPVVFNRVNLTLKKLFSPLLKDSGKEYGNGYYWSSTELGNVEAYNLNAERYSGSYNNYRHQSFYVRAICRF